MGEIDELKAQIAALTARLDGKTAQDTATAQAEALRQAEEKVIVAKAKAEELTQTIAKQRADDAAFIAQENLLETALQDLGTMRRLDDICKRDPQTKAAIDRRWEEEFSVQRMTAKLRASRQAQR